MAHRIAKMLAVFFMNFCPCCDILQNENKIKPLLKIYFQAINSQHMTQETYLAFRWSSEKWRNGKST